MKPVMFWRNSNGMFRWQHSSMKWVAEEVGEILSIAIVYRSGETLG